MPDRTTAGAWVADLAWDQVQERIMRGAIGVLPVGAAAKEHGWHLPMSTDQIQVEALAGRLTGSFDVLVWPTLTYGHYPAFLEYAGSVSISQDLFVRLASSLATAILGQGIQRLCVLNSGISTKPALARLEQEMSGCELINIYDGPICSELSQTLADLRGEGHAGMRETSIMLAIAADRVVMERAKVAGPPNPEPGPLRRQDAAHPNFSPSGVLGDPRKADPHIGLSLWDAIWADVSGAIQARAAVPS